MQQQADCGPRCDPSHGHRGNLDQAGWISLAVGRVSSTRVTDFARVSQFDVIGIEFSIEIVDTGRYRVWRPWNPGLVKTADAALTAILSRLLSVSPALYRSHTQTCKICLLLTTVALNLSNLLWINE